MHAQSAVELSPAVFADAAGCRLWLEQLVRRDADPLQAIGQLLRSLQADDRPVDHRLAIAEGARSVHLKVIERCVSVLQGEPFPLPPAGRQRLALVCAHLALGRDLYVGLHRHALDVNGGEARAVIPGVAESLDTVLPMIRSLDYQVRLIVALQLNGFEVAGADWDRLCSAAQAVRVSTFQDEVVPDEVALFASATARGLFIYPLLIELARPAERSPVEKWLIARLARRWSAKVGFRIESGSATRVSPNGPVLALTTARVVRLDTHRLMSRLMAQRAELDAMAQGGPVRLPRGMSLAGTRALLAQLVESWSPGVVLQPLSDAHGGDVGLRFGLPTSPLAGMTGGTASNPRDPSGSLWQYCAERASIYGRFESHDALRGARLLARPAGGLADWAGGAERAVRVASETGGREVFERVGTAPLALGDLAAIVSLGHPAGQRPGTMGSVAGTASVMRFGKVTALSQQSLADPGGTPRQRVQVLPWAGVPSLVEVGAPAEATRVPAVLLAGDVPAGEPETLLLPAGRLSGLPVLALREAGCDREVRLEAVLESGRGFVRVRLRRTGT